jgi:LDH2 family malate/lactate/ureidoglycolate dehydrogenase
MASKKGLTVLFRDFDLLASYISTLFVKSGLPEQDAEVVANNYLQNNVIGIDSHGVRLVPNCVLRLREGGINPRPNMEVKAEAASVARLDGDNGLGQLTALRGMDLAIKKADKTGVGFVVCTNTNNAGVMGSYTRIPLQRGMAGLAMATTVPSMFAWGGLKRVISNPPISISFPGRKQHFILDICLGSVAWNKIYMKRDKGQPLPGGWAVDSHGVETTKPESAANGGSVIPIGGHKGYGLSLAIELLTAILGGHLFGKDLKGLFDDPKESEGITITVAALDVTKLIQSEVLFDRLEAYFDFIKSSPRRPDAEEIMIPGEPEDRIQNTRRQGGLPLPPEVVEALKTCGAELRVSFPFE